MAQLTPLSTQNSAKVPVIGSSRHRRLPPVCHQHTITHIHSSIVCHQPFQLVSSTHWDLLGMTRILDSAYKISDDLRNPFQWSSHHTMPGE